MILFILLISRHGKIRLQKFFRPTPVKKRTQIMKEVSESQAG